MNNNVHLTSARGYYGPSHLVMPNYWTPWQQQSLMYSLRPLPAWIQPAIPQVLNPYMPFRGMVCGAAPQVVRSVQLPCQLLGKACESCLFGLSDHMGLKPGRAVETAVIADTAAPRQQIPTQAHDDPEAQRGEPVLFAPHDLIGADAAKEDKAELDRDRTAPAKRGRVQKTAGMRKRRRAKADADGRRGVNGKLAGQEAVAGDVGSDRSVTSAQRKRQRKAERTGAQPQVSTPKSHLHERIAESIRVYHRLGDKTIKSSPPQLQKRTPEADSHRLAERSAMLPLKPKAGKRKMEGELGLQDCAHAKTFPGVSTPSLVPGSRSGNTPAASTPELTAERSTPTPRSQAKTLVKREPSSRRWPTSPALPQDVCCAHTFPLVLEESTPIQAWQREEREAMKVEARKQREQAARVTRMGLDYATDKEGYAQESLGLDTFNKLPFFKSFLD